MNRYSGVILVALCRVHITMNQPDSLRYLSVWMGKLTAKGI